MLGGDTGNASILKLLICTQRTPRKFENSKSHLSNKGRWDGCEKREMCLPASFFVWGVVVIQGKVWLGRENSSLGRFGGKET